MIDRIVAALARFLLVLVVSLQLMWFTEAWDLLVPVMVIGTLIMWLREELTAVSEVCAGASGEEQEGDQGQCGQERLG